MKIALFARGIADHTVEEIHTLVTSIEGADLEWIVNEEFACQIETKTSIKVAADKRYTTLRGDAHGADVLVCYGGDGTFLKGVKRIYGTRIAIVGINSGRLGFLANVRKEDIDMALSNLKNGEFTTEKRSLLEIGGDIEKECTNPFAFNEVTIQRNGAGMIAVEAYVDNEMVGRYWGDGIIISTPSGSTAYSLSVGGAILAPGCECFILSPIAPHNLTMRPIVLPDSSQLTFRISTRDKTALVTVDNNTYTVGNDATIRVQRAKQSLTMVCFGNNTFYDTLRNKMMWGMDRRDAESDL